MAFRPDQINSLPYFDGSTDTNDWIRMFKIMAVFQDWDEPKQIKYIDLFLKGKASNVYKKTCPTATTINTIDPLFTALIVGCKKSEAQLHALFRARRKLPHETFGQFGAAIYDLLKL